MDVKEEKKHFTEETYVLYMKTDIKQQWINGKVHEVERNLSYVEVLCKIQALTQGKEFWVYGYAKQEEYDKAKEEAEKEAAKEIQIGLF